METDTQLTVGMGVTCGIGSDCYPYTLIEIVNERTIIVQEDRSKPEPGSDFYKDQRYAYTPNPNGGTFVLTLRKNGRWVRKGETLNSGFHWHLGTRRMYQNPSF